MNFLKRSKMRIFQRNSVFFVILFVLVTGGYIEAQSHSRKKTYKIGDTEYIVGETYSTTGLPKVERSSSAKNKFLKSKGYKNVPKGYHVDHIVPLSQGGSDSPGNMQLISVHQHKVKTANERKMTSKQSSSSQYKNYNCVSGYNYYSTPSFMKSSGYDSFNQYKTKMPKMKYKSGHSYGRRRK